MYGESAKTDPLSTEDLNEAVRFQGSTTSAILTIHVSALSLLERCTFSPTLV